MDGYAKRTQQKKEKILKAAKQLFLERGFTDTSIAEIAAQAGVSQVTIYNYFNSKENLLKEVMQAYMTEAIGKAEALLDMDVPFAQKVAMLFAYGKEEQASISPTFTNTIAWEDPALQAIYREIAATKAIPMIIRFVQMGQAEGAIDSTIPVEAVLAYISGMMPILTNKDFLKTSQEYKEGINKLFYYGLLGKMKDKE